MRLFLKSRGTLQNYGNVVRARDSRKLELCFPSTICLRQYSSPYLIRSEFLFLLPNDVSNAREKYVGLQFLRNGYQFRSK